MVEFIKNLDKSVKKATGFNCKTLFAAELASAKLPNTFDTPI